MKGTWVYDLETEEFVTREELGARRAKRSESKRGHVKPFRRCTPGTYVYDAAIGRLVPKGARQRVDAPGLGILGLDYVRNPVDGKRYTCMRAYERAVERGGGAIVAGMNPKSYLAPVQKEPSMRDVVADVKKAIEMQSSLPSR